MQIYVTKDDRVLVSWDDKGPSWLVSPGGVVLEQSRIQGDLVWMDGERGFSSGYNVGHDEGYEQASLDFAEESAPTAVAS